MVRTPSAPEFTERRGQSLSATPADKGIHGTSAIMRRASPPIGESILNVIVLVLVSRHDLLTP